MAGQEKKRETKEQIVQRLQNLVRKAKVYCQGAEEVECRILLPVNQGHPFTIEVFQKRFVRRISVDVLSVQHLNLGQPDPSLMRELRSAIMAVQRLAGHR
ncbi:MAG: hypothetical protein HY046_04850 [Acidobacteria bacterium]|nr:hypothetical protein [Acidobacteriota bacterium]